MRIIGGILLLIMTVPFIFISIMDIIDMKKKNVCGDMNATVGGLIVLLVLLGFAVIVLLQGLGIIQ